MPSSRKLPDYKCPHCGANFRPHRESSRYCSKVCRWANNGGHNKKYETWWINAKGYVEGRVWMPNGTQRRVKKHRLVMENHLGRMLMPDEDVHHINGDKTDNRPENLQLIKHGEHSTHHNIHDGKQRSGHKMNLTPEQRKARSDRAKAMKIGDIGRAAIAKALGHSNP